MAAQGSKQSRKGSGKRLSRDHSQYWFSLSPENRPKIKSSRRPKKEMALLCVTRSQKNREEAKPQTTTPVAELPTDTHTYQSASVTNNKSNVMLSVQEENAEPSIEVDHSVNNEVDNKQHQTLARGESRHVSLIESNEHRTSESPEPLQAENPGISLENINQIDSSPALYESNTGHPSTLLEERCGEVGESSMALRVELSDDEKEMFFRHSGETSN